MQSENGHRIYSSFPGNVDEAIITSMEAEAEQLPQEVSKPTAECEPTLIYSRKEKCKFNKLFNAMLSESMPLSNFYFSISETETYKKLALVFARKPPEEAKILMRQLEYANQMYIKSLNLMRKLNPGKKLSYLSGSIKICEAAGKDNITLERE